MTKWQYKVAVYDGPVIGVEAWLNKQGADGWELVTIVRNQAELNYAAVFKRRESQALPPGKKH